MGGSISHPEGAHGWPVTLLGPESTKTNALECNHCRVPAT